MSGDEYNRRVHARMQEELQEFDTPQARYQAVLDRHWQAQRDLEFEDDDMYQVGGFVEFHSTTPSYTKGRRDPDWRVR
jgi:hypothetical protein